MAAAHPRRLHRARGGEVGRPEADPVHARGGSGDRLDIVDAFGGLQDGVDENGFADAVFCFKLRQDLVEVMNVPSTFDLGQHDNIELVADRGDDFADIVQHPR